MIPFELSKGLEPNLRILAAEFERLSKEYAVKMEKNSERPPSPINTPMASEHRHGNFQGRSEGYGHAARELTNLLNWFGVPGRPEVDEPS
jgi:hypothetical protein